MAKRNSIPKMWIAYARAICLKDENKKEIILVSSFAHISRKAGLKDITEQMDIIFNAREYKNASLGYAFGMSYLEVQSIFQESEDRDDDGHDDDVPEVPPEPEDHGVKVPALFTDLIDSLSIE